MESSHTLAVHRFLLRASIALGGVFVWTLMFHALYVGGETVSGALFITAMAFIFLQLSILFLTPVAAQNAPHGIMRSMLLATLAQAAAFLWFGAAAAGVFGSDALNIWWGIIGFVALSALYRAFYWVPYSVAATPRSTWTYRTKLLLEIFLALLPVVAVIIMTSKDSGTWLVMIGAAILAFFSSIALIRIPDSFERFSWGYAETIRVLFSKENRTLFLSSVLEGIEGAGLLFLWPLTIFFMFQWSYFTLGLILSITLLCVLLGRRSMQKFMRSRALHEHHRFLSALVGTTWILRLTLIHPITIILADALNHMGVSPRRSGMDMVTLEQAADSSHYIDEYTALKEMGNACGRAFLALLFILILAVSIVPVALGACLAITAAAAIASIYHAYAPVEV